MAHVYFQNFLSPNKQASYSCEQYRNATQQIPSSTTAPLASDILGKIEEYKLYADMKKFEQNCGKGYPINDVQNISYILKGNSYCKQISTNIPTYTPPALLPWLFGFQGKSSSNIISKEVCFENQLDPLNNKTVAANLQDLDRSKAKIENNKITPTTHTEYFGLVNIPSGLALDEGWPHVTPSLSETEPSFSEKASDLVFSSHGLLIGAALLTAGVAAFILMNQPPEEVKEKGKEKKKPLSPIAYQV